MRSLNSLLRIAFKDYFLVGKIFFWLCFSKWMIFNRSLEDILDWISTELSSPGYNKHEYIQIAKISKYTLTISRYVPFKSLCYDKALTVKKVLNDEGVFSELHFGVEIASSDLKGHVWIVRDGMVAIGGDVSDRFKSLRIFT